MKGFFPYITRKSIFFKFQLWYSPLRLFSRLVHFTERVDERIKETMKRHKFYINTSCIVCNVDVICEPRIPSYISYCFFTRCILYSLPVKSLARFAIFSADAAYSYRHRSKVTRRPRYYSRPRVNRDYKSSFAYSRN